MKNNKKIRVFLVTLFKMSVHLIALLIFIKGFDDHYNGMQNLSRTSGVVTACFIFVTTWMTSVYGKIDIGEKKTKPLFHTIALNLLITNAMTFIALRVMTINVSNNFWIDLRTLLFVYIVQLIILRLLIGVANSLYFVNYIPEKTLIVYQNDNNLEKLVKYIKRHKKQYQLVDVIQNPSLKDIDLEEYSNIFVMDLEEEFLRTLVLKSMMMDVTIYYHATIPYVILSNKETFIVDDILFFMHKTKKITPIQKSVKRFIDIFFSLLGLIIASPIMIVIAIAIKIEDRGPILFTQDRVTQNGRIFKIYKFRSMKENSGDDPATKNDDRITKVGHITRKVRVDELPQLFNIIKGDMSIVGPRPESVSITKEILEQFPEFAYRYKVQAGLTGTAQIFGKYNTDAQDKLLFDLYYIENFSLFNDINLMFQTLIVFIKKDSTEGFEKE